MSNHDLTIPLKIFANYSPVSYSLHMFQYVDELSDISFCNFININLKKSTQQKRVSTRICNLLISGEGS
jgi:hypothetical protein